MNELLGRDWAAHFRCPQIKKDDAGGVGGACRRFASDHFLCGAWEKALRPENMMKIRQTLRVSTDYLLTGNRNTRTCPALCRSGGSGREKPHGSSRGALVLFGFALPAGACGPPAGRGRRGLMPSRGCLSGRGRGLRNS